MILLIFAVLSLLVISLWLTYELVKCQKRISYKNECLVAYKERTEEYWLKYLDMQRKNRSKALLIKELQEELAESNEQLGAWYKANLALEEELESVQLELQNEAEWAMEYQESLDKMAKQHEHEREFWYLEYQRQLDKIHELEVKNEHFKHELEYYRQKYDGDYDPIE